MIGIPIYPVQTQSADFSFEIELNLQLVSLHIQWNSRSEFFHLNFTDTEGSRLTSIKLVPNWALLRNHKALIDFSGDFIILKDDPSLTDTIEYDNLGNGYNMYYLTEEEVSTWESTNGL